MQRITINSEEKMILSKGDIGKKLIVNNEPAAVVSSLSNDAVIARKINEKTIELMCYEGEESNSLSLQRVGIGGIPVCEYAGLRDYVISLYLTGIGNERFDHYNSQLARHSGFIPYT